VLPLARTDAAALIVVLHDGDPAAVDALEARWQSLDVERWVLVAALAVAGLGLLPVLRRTLGGETTTPAA